MNIDWFNEARYGMFIHWGAYSQASRGEWIMNRELIPQEEYHAKYVENFRAENFDAADWAKKAVKWGMKYMVLTTRHHDGFSLWDSKVNSWNSVNYGPKRDIVAEYVEAAHNAGIKVGLYYSPANWVHEDYPGAFYRDWPGEEDWASEASRQRFVEYYRAELEELMTNYGQIDYLWFDGCIPENIDGEASVKLLRKWQPKMLINNRLGGDFDIQVCEQCINPPKEVIDWESCMTLNSNWGYHAGDSRWKSVVDVVDMLLSCAKDGGNLLLNIGPKGDGSIPIETVKILDKVGEWLVAHREAVEKTTRHPFSWNCTARPITYANQKIYLNFLNFASNEFCWGELANRVEKAYYLDSGLEVRFKQENNRLFLLDLPNRKDINTIVLEIIGEPKVIRAQTTFWIPE